MPPRLLAFLFLPVFALPCLAQSDTLRYTFLPGASLTYKRSENTRAFSQTLSGRSSTIDRLTDAYMTLVGLATGPGRIAYRYEQDTAIVENRIHQENDPSGIDFPNLLTRKPVRVDMTTRGELISAHPLMPLNVAQYLPAGVGENAVARQAMIFPLLPERALHPGLKWMSTRRDTLHPSQSREGLGTGKGLKYVAEDASYSVDTTETVGGLTCLTLSWKSVVDEESKMIFPKQESYSETHTETTGTLYFAVASGLLVKSVLTSEETATNALYGEQNDIVPTSTTTEVTLQLLSHH